MKEHVCGLSRCQTAGFCQLSQILNDIELAGSQQELAADYPDKADIKKVTETAIQSEVNSAKQRGCPEAN